MFRTLQKLFTSSHAKKTLNTNTWSTPKWFPFIKNFSSHSNTMKVTVVGGSGKIYYEVSIF